MPSKPQLNLSNNRDVQQMSTEQTAHRMQTNKNWGESSSYENKYELNGMLTV
jgi:hypothetical protein